MNKVRTQLVKQAKALDIGSRIRATRVKQDMTVEAAARKLGVSPDYLSFIERSRPDPISDEMADKLVDKLGVPKAHLTRLRTKHNQISYAFYRAYRDQVKKKAAA